MLESSGSPRAAPRSGSTLLDRGRRAVRADQHDRRRLRDGRAVRARPRRRGRRGRPRACRRPGTRSGSPRTPAAYRAAPAGARRARRRAAGVAGRGDAMPEHLRRPRWAPRRRDTITLLGHDLAERRDGRGRLRRAGVLAGHPAPAEPGRDPGLRGGAGRAGRPRLHPDRDRHPADLPVARPTRSRARSPPACSAAARGSSASPRTAAGSCTTCSTGSTTLPDRRRRLGRGRAATSYAGSARRAVRARPRPPRAQGRRPAHPAAVRRSPREEGLFGPHLALFDAIGRVHPRGARQDAAAQRRRRLRRRAGRPRPAAGAAARLRAAGPHRRA